MKLPKFKSATKLALFSTAIMIGAVMILYVWLSFSFVEKRRQVENTVFEGGVNFITEQLEKNAPYETIKYPYVYFIVYDLDKNIIFDGSEGNHNENGSLSRDYSMNDGQRQIKIISNITESYRPENIEMTIILSLIPAIFISFMISSLIIDRTLNPVRVMIEKVKSVGNKNFKSKIFINSAEDELREYAYAFNEMSSKINEYIEKQKQFISDASHELVTPITVIVGHTDMLIRWGKEDKVLLDSELRIIKNEALSMNELIENLLFFARTDNKKISYTREELNLTELLKECLMEQSMLHPDFEITFAPPNRSLIVPADYDALKQVMRILFANSVKYSFQRKEIHLMAERTGQSVHISLSDKGIGMEREYLNKIFDRFYRIDDSRTKETGGTGLGLAIAKEIILAHNGTITAQSEINEGTTMVIRMELVK